MFVTLHEVQPLLCTNDGGAGGLCGCRSGSRRGSGMGRRAGADPRAAATLGFPPAGSQIWRAARPVAMDLLAERYSRRLRAERVARRRAAHAGLKGWARGATCLLRASALPLPAPLQLQHCGHVPRQPAAAHRLRRERGGLCSSALRSVPRHHAPHQLGERSNRRRRAQRPPAHAPSRCRLTRLPPAQPPVSRARRLTGQP